MGVGSFQMSYDQHITKEYDAQFKKEKENLKWYPWVGKNYHETGIFILGKNTDDRNGPDGSNWTLNLKPPLTFRDASRAIVANINKASDDPFQKDSPAFAFQNTAKMFIEGVGAQYDKHTRAVFWEAVAFNNFVQEVIKQSTQVEDVDDGVLQKSRAALSSTINILKPKVVLVWGVQVVDAIDALSIRGEKKINGAYPRVIKQTPPIVGIRDPSRSYTPRSEWLEFLKNDPASKKPIGEFLDYLKEQLS